MELKLVVLAGAKEGLEIPLKKDKFLIGRSKECTLRAPSEAISRRHCAIVRENGSWTVRDLGSRNGTYLNDERIADVVPLKAGDELRVGPLKFRVAPGASAAPSSKAKSAPASAAKPTKQPKIKDVADVVQRTINNAEAGATEDDVSRWLLGIPDDDSEAVLKETRSMRREDTAVNRTVSVDQRSTVEAEVLSEDATEQLGEEAENEAEKSSGWAFFKRAKGAVKKKPGKLPPRPDAQTKDSREAAADILREMTRRR